MQVVCHQLTALIVRYRIPIQVSVRFRVEGEPHYSDEIDRLEAVGSCSLPKLSLDRECRIEQGPVVEVVLFRALHLYQEPLAVLVGALNVHPDIFPSGVLVRTFLRSVGQAGDLTFRNHRLKEKEHQTFGVAVFLE